MSKNKPNIVLRWTHYIILFVIIVGNINLMKGALEIFPAIFPEVANEVDGKITRHYLESRTRTGGQSSAVSYYLEAQYEINGKTYTNNDWTSEQGYSQLKTGTPITMVTLKGFPGIGLIKENQANVIRNNKIGVYIIVIVDILYVMFVLFRWRKKRKQKKLNN